MPLHARRFVLAALWVAAVPGLAGARSSAPIISQLRPPGAPSDYRGGARCGPTAMAMVARAYGKGEGDSDAALIAMLDRLDGRLNHGTGSRAMERMAGALGLGAHTHRGYRREIVDRSLARGAFILALGDATRLPHNRWLDARVPAGHWIAVVGRDAWGNFIVHDPYFGPGTALRSGRYVLEPDQLASFVDGVPKGTLVAVSRR